MDEDGIVRICEALDLKCGRAYAGTLTWGSNMSISCPLAVKKHGDLFDENMSCSIKVVDDGPSECKCWSGNCRFKGKLVDLVKAAVYMRGNPPELIELLKEVEATEAVTGKARNLRAKKKIEALVFSKAHPRNRDVLPESVFAPFAGKVPQYAAQRGITLETAKAWGLGYDKPGGFLVFPVRRRDQRLVGLVGRAVSDRAKRRHHNYMGLDKSKHLFGAHMLKPNLPVVIVESCIDTLNTWQALKGEANVVATLGEGFSVEHVHTLAAIRPPAVYIFTDGDQAGRLMAKKIAYILHGSAIIKLMECPWGPITGITADGKFERVKVDPSVLPPSYTRKIFKEATSVRKKIKWTNPPPVFDPQETT